MHNHHSVTTTKAVVVHGITYRVQPLPSEFQSDVVGPRSRTYYASLCGNILSCTNRNTWRVLKPSLVPNDHGELRQQAHLSISGKSQKLYVHTLIARTFCTGHGQLDRNGNQRDQVNHIDQNQLNNKPANLHWVSAAENRHHAAVVMPAVAAEADWIANGYRASGTTLLILDAIDDWATGEPMDALTESYGKDVMNVAVYWAEAGTFAESLLEAA